MSWKERKEAGVRVLWELERSLNLSEPQAILFREGR